MIWEDNQHEINNRIHQFFYKDYTYSEEFAYLSEEERESIRFMHYNEGYEENFDYDLYDYLVGQEVNFECYSNQ